jgi:hypothetical protein
LTVEGSSSTLGVENTFGEVRPSLGRRRGPRISTLKDDVITTPGPSPLGSSPRIRLGQAARLVTPRPRPAVPRGHQPDPRPRQINSGVGPANGRPGQAPADWFSFRANSDSVRADTATPGFGSSKSGLGVPLTKQEKPRATRLTEPRDSYASGIRIPHSSPLHGRLTLGEAVQTTNRRVLVLENEEKIHTCSGLDSHNEQKTGIQGAIANRTPVPSPRV